MMKKIFTLVLLCVLVFCSGYKKPYRYTIKAEKDAYVHNNIGLNYLQDRIYYAAIQEFKIAIQLSPNTQTTAIFKNNLGETYMYIGYPEMARVCFEDAVHQYGLNLKYYMNLAQCYETLDILKTKIDELSKSENTYDQIMLGILYTKTGDERKGIIKLDEICQALPSVFYSRADLHDC